MSIACLAFSVTTLHADVARAYGASLKTSNLAKVKILSVQAFTTQQDRKVCNGQNSSYLLICFLDFDASLCRSGWIILTRISLDFL